MLSWLNLMTGGAEGEALLNIDTSGTWAVLLSEQCWVRYETLLQVTLGAG